MAAPRFVTPELRLSKLIEEPGGLTPEEAVRRANANLESIRPTCRAELMAVLERAEALFREIGEAPDVAAIDRLYDLAVGAIGGGDVSGAPGVDETLKHLSDLIDALRGRTTFDRPAVGVHLQSWRLLMTAAPNAQARAAILDGLTKVAERYA